MPNYDFKSLSPIDFEILVRDLLQKEFMITLESFKAGRDSGIDFRYSRGAGDLIVQCKHYAESTFPTLLSTVKRELTKVRKLAPVRYVFASSLGFTPVQKQELITALNPFVRTSGDVFGREDLNNLLTRFPEVERHTPKLWLSSTTVFEEILHSRVRNVSRQTLEKICERSRLYVQNDSFEEALALLNKHNICIIAGIPGIGKTTLAEMLLLHFVNTGYQLVQIDHDIAEAQDLPNCDEKRAFYYDDFLGQVSIGEKLNKNEEQRLLNFMQATKKSKSSKLILTTREYILNQAKLLYEKVDRAKFAPETCVVDLSKYTRMIRAQILFNHLYFSDLPRPYLEALIKNRLYLKIVDHPNYNPRIIEQMTLPGRLYDVTHSDYGQVFLHNLTNPTEIWRHAFEEQLSEASRSTLIVMATSLEAIGLPELQEAVEAFHLAKCQQFRIVSSPRDFHRSLKELEGNFVTTSKDIKPTGAEGIFVAYHNPSVRDFVRNYLGSAVRELTLLIQTSLSFEQLVTLWRYRDDTESGRLFAEALQKNIAEFINAMWRTLTSGNAIARPIYEIWRKRKWINFEKRLEFILSVSRTRSQIDISVQLDSALEQVRCRLAENNLGADDLVALLAELARYDATYVDRYSTLMRETYEYVSEGFDTLDSFQPFLAFAETFPDLVPSDKMEEVGGEFRDVAGSAAEDEHDADRVREVASQIEELGSRFGVDMSDCIEGMEEWAKECERNARQEYSDDEWRGYDASDKSCGDLDIDSMFSAL